MWIDGERQNKEGRFCALEPADRFVCDNIRRRDQLMPANETWPGSRVEFTKAAHALLETKDFTHVGIGADDGRRIPALGEVFRESPRHSGQSIGSGLSGVMPGQKTCQQARHRGACPRSIRIRVFEAHALLGQGCKMGRRTAQGILKIHGIRAKCVHDVDQHIRRCGFGALASRSRYQSDPRQSEAGKPPCSAGVAHQPCALCARDVLHEGLHGLPDVARRRQSPDGIWEVRAC